MRCGDTARFACWTLISSSGLPIAMQSGLLLAVSLLACVRMSAALAIGVTPRRSQPTGGES